MRDTCGGKRVPGAGAEMGELKDHKERCFYVQSARRPSYPLSRRDSSWSAHQGNWRGWRREQRCESHDCGERGGGRVYRGEYGCSGAADVECAGEAAPGCKATNRARRGGEPGWGGAGGAGGGVTRPFGFEGKRRMMQAERGMQELLESVDTVIVIPNEKLLAVAKDAGFFESFRIADDVLRQGVQGISDIITIPGVINRDFADVKTTMAGMGYAVMGTAVRSGANRAIEAAQAAMASPLLEAGAIDGARGILINITGSSNLKLSE